MDETRMSAKQYAKFEKVFFLYGSVTKMVQPVRPDEWKRLAEEMWSWAIQKVGALVDASTDGFLEPPPELETPVAEAPAAEPPHDQEQGRGDTLKKKYITVKAVQPVKTGQRGGSTWTLTRVVDTDNVRYTTFAGHRYEVGKQYPIEWEESQNGQYINRTIKEPKDRNAMTTLMDDSREPGDEQDSDIPF